jgi:hypothetical protein
MDMLKVVKIRSIENAVYDTRLNRMRFKVPADNLNTHLNESYLSFQVEIVDPVGNPLDAQNNVGFGNDWSIYYATCLLKTVRLFRGDSNIPLEEIQNFNMLDQNLKAYEKGIEEHVSDQFTSGFIEENLYQGIRSPFYWNGESNIQIPLKDIFGLCKNKDFYLSDTNGLQMEFELEDRFSLFNEVLADNDEEEEKTGEEDDDNDFQDANDSDDDRSLLPPSNSSEVNPDGEGVIDQDGISTASNKKRGPPLSLELYHMGVTYVVPGTQPAYDVKGGYPATFNISTATQEFIKSGIKVNGVSTAAEDADLNAAGLANLLSFYATITSATGGNGSQYIPMEITGYTPAVFTSGVVTTAAQFTLFVPSEVVATPTALFTEVNTIAFVNKLRPDADLITIPLAIPNQQVGKPTTYTYLPEGSTLFSNTSNYKDAAGNALLTFADTNVVIRGKSYTTKKVVLDASIIPGGGTLAVKGIYEFQYMHYLDGQYEQFGLSAISKLVESVNKPESIYSGSRATVNKYTSKLYTLEATGDRELTFKFANGCTSFKNIQQSFKKRVESSFGQLVLRRIDSKTTSNLGEYMPTAYTYQIPTAELVLLQESKKSSDNVTNVYQTWKMEPTLIESNTYSWQRQFILEPNVGNSIFLNIPAGFNSLYSDLGDIYSYRWSLDNIDNTNRDVLLPSALNNDKLIDLFNNTGLNIKNLETNDDNTGIIPMKIYTAMDNDNVSMDNKTHTLQLVLNGDVDAEIEISAKNVYLYKQVLKQL